MHFVLKFHKYRRITLLYSYYSSIIIISIHIGVTRISKARTCRMEIPSDRSNIGGGDRHRESTGSTMLDCALDGARRGRTRGRRGFCNGKLRHEKVVKRGRTARRREDQGGDADLNIDVEVQWRITKRGLRCMAAPYDLSCPAPYRVPPLRAVPPRYRRERRDLIQPHVLS